MLSAVSIGYIALLSAAILLASGSVFIGAYSATIPPTVIAFVGFTGAAIAAWLLPTGMRPELRRGDLFLLAGANLATVCVFISYYYALTLAEPALVAATQSGSSPLFAFVVALLVPQIVPPEGRLARLSLLLVLIAVLLTVVVAATDLSGLEIVSSGQALLGMALALISGASTYVLTVLLKALGRRGWSTVQIIRFRFVFIMMLTGWFSLGTSEGQAALRLILTTSLLPLCLAFVALPMFLIQTGVLRLPVITVLMAINAIPVLTYVIQLADGRISMSVWSLVATVMTTVGIVAYIVSVRNQQTE